MSGPHDLEGWVAYIQTLHARSVDMELSRVARVRHRLDSAPPAPLVISVAGTNGKGSTVALCESICLAAGLRVGAYTSPHLVRYNERVRVDGVAVGDDELVDAFAAVEAARGDEGLTYFEFGTLAAARVLRQRRVEVALLEVGLGGRLDAVNVYDADVAVISSIGLDHQQWLGRDRESIGHEKAGIARPGRPVVCADPDPPASIARHARSVGADLWQLGSDFTIDPGPESSWRYRSRRPGHLRMREGLPSPAIPGDRQHRNLAGALTALGRCGPLGDLPDDVVRRGVAAARLAGRIDVVSERPRVILDVAHNPEAVATLTRYLSETELGGRTLAVLGLLRDKPVGEVVRLMSPLVDAWWLATLDDDRGARAEELRPQVARAAPGAELSCHADPGAAFASAMKAAGAADRVIVFGSFFTVGAIMRRLGLP